MFETKHGSFDGSSWEDLMQLCFRLKYENEHYQPIPASSGDCGIEGFTKTGKVFQCYCPDDNLPSKQLYEKQRDKITADIPKLKLYQKKLATFLDGVQIKEWILVTPEFRMNDLVAHCAYKRQEVVDENLEIIAPEFKVIIHDIDFFQKELAIALGTENKKLFIAPEKQLEKNVTNWKESEIDLAENALRKHSKRFEGSSSTIEKKVNELTDATIESFLDRETILRKWRQMHPDDFDKFLILTGQIEKEVQEKCMFPAADKNELYRSLRSLVKDRLQANFGYLTEITLESLTNGAIADWLLRCPLDFE